MDNYVFISARAAIPKDVLLKFWHTIKRAFSHFSKGQKTFVSARCCGYRFQKVCLSINNILKSRYYGIHWSAICTALVNRKSKEKQCSYCNWQIPLGSGYIFLFIIFDSIIYRTEDWDWNHTLGWFQYLGDYFPIQEKKIRRRVYPWMRVFVNNICWILCI